ncbi:SRPBCC domain-containing protein [Chloroflexi bacterium TSY]|nr:SRPBCC domain-containing protein [Chloroflexi bacterium TSY]
MTKAPTSLKMSRTFNASRDRVYQAWTKPELLAKWFHPTEKHISQVDEFDLRVGGSYRISMIAGDNAHIVQGKYEAVDPPEKLSFTWGWEGAEDPREMLVTVEFNQLTPTETEVILTHERFANDEERDSHKWGWNGTLDRLSVLLAKANPEK